MGFRPVGEKSRRALVVELISPLEPDTIITYQEIAEHLNLVWPRDKDLVQSSVATARNELANDHHQALAAVRTVGYRVIRPEEHVEEAGRLQRKAGKTIALAKTTVDTVNLGALDPEQRKLAMAAAAVLGYQADQIRRMDLRQKGLEKVLGSVTEKVDEVAAATDAHKDRLAALERRLQELETDK